MHWVNWINSWTNCLDRKFIRFLSRLPPARTAKTQITAGTLARAWWITARPEFMVSIAIIVLGIPTLYHLPRQNGVLSFWLLEGAGVVVWCLSIVTAASLNCLADHEIDRLDTLGKDRYSRAIDAVGSLHLWLINIALMALNSVFVLILTLLRTQPALVIIWSVGIAIGIMYSFEPWRLKRRGLLNTLAVITGCFALPMLFTSFLLADELPVELAIIITLFSLQMSALSFADQISDYSEDLSNITLTVCVLLGRRATAFIAVVAYAVISLGLLVALTVVLSVPVHLERLIALLLGSIPLSWVLRDLQRLLEICKSIEYDVYRQEERSIQYLKRSIRTPLWIALSGVSVCFVLGCRLLL